MELDDRLATCGWHKKRKHPMQKTYDATNEHLETKTPGKHQVFKIGLAY
jgi:hypothetical protein